MIRLIRRAIARVLTGNIPTYWIWIVLRMASYSLLFALCLTTELNAKMIDVFAGDTRLMRSFFFSVLGLTLFLLTFRRLMPCRTRRNGYILSRFADLLCINAMILLVAGELGLTVLSRMRPSPLFWSEPSGLQTRIDSMRWKPGLQYFNYRTNSRGYYDAEFITAKPGDLVIGVLADSFGVGVVPYEYNFVTVAERLLKNAVGNSYDRVAIHNFGIPGIAMAEYAYLLQTEVLPTHPTLLVLCLFVGNDVIETQKFIRNKTRNRYALQNWLICEIPRRLFIIRRESRRVRDAEQVRDPPVTGMDNGGAPGHIDDSAIVVPPISEQKYLELECWRYEVCNPRNRRWQEGFQGIYEGLKYFKATLGGRLIVVLLPDEFQVNDDLHRAILQSRAKYAAYQRDYPQQQLSDWCSKNDVACVDMLPALREAEKNGRTYHLRNTHFNARGNQIVGTVLAQTIAKHIEH